MKKFLLALALFANPALALAAGPPTSFCALVSVIIDILNGFTALLVLAALVSYLYGISIHINKAGEAKNNLKSIILWGIVGLFVMVSIWGILHILQTTLFPIDTVSGKTC